ncbi:MAG: DUF1839 family protein [Gemmatimonadales bacterium]
MSRQQVLPGLSAADYQRHAVHAPDCHWVERNCYVDVIIEMLHALGLEPLAALGVTAAIDFEGDNFTFMKPNHEDLRVLYGVDIQEMNVWLPLLEHARHHLAEGKFISTEADSFWLPDTSGTDYQRNHVKSTIVLADLDEGAKRLGYFHNAGYFELEGEDFDQLFRVGVPRDPTFLPLFAELVRVDRMVHRPSPELAQMAFARLGVYLDRRPATNPVRRFQARFEQELPRLQELGLAHYHAWAFATTRQLGAAAELLSMHVKWLADAGSRPELAPAAASFLQVSALCKTFILKAARAVNSKKPFDASPLFDEMATAWESGMAVLDRAVATASTGVPA